jgi:antitoxin VapB
MSLNIKNPEACRLIEALSAATGETMTGAVITAVRERLDRVQRRENAPLAERLLAIGRDCAARLGPEYRALDHDALLYDEKGLPR